MKLRWWQVTRRNKEREKEMDNIIAGILREQDSLRRRVTILETEAAIVSRNTDQFLRGQSLSA